MQTSTLQGRPHPIEKSPVYTINNWWVFLIFSFLAAFSAYYLQTEVLTDNVYYNSLGDRFGADRIESVIQLKHKVGFLGIMLAPVTLLIRVLFACLCLRTGLLFSSHKLTGKNLFTIVLYAEGAFAAGTLVKLLMLAFIRSIDRFEDLQSFAPLSLFSLFKDGSVPSWLSYPLQALNLFELGYWLLLAVGLRHFLGGSFRKMLGLVLSSYGLGLLGWMLCVTFLNINAAQ